MKLLLVFAAILVPALSARLPYIIGGNDVNTPGKWPWHASLQYLNSHICGAVLIGDRWLVTAAHCVGTVASKYSVVLGMHDRVSMAQGDPKRYGVSRVISHPSWNNNGRLGFPNDIALLYLSQQPDASQYVSPVELPSSGQIFEGSECYITGWGRISDTSVSSDILQEAQVDVYTQISCQGVWSTIPIGDYHICVGKFGESGGCSGDSGGPLVCPSGNSWVLAGVTSWGRSDCNVYYPFVYARISYFREWIRDNSGI